ncbi:hypothetical protein JZ751_020791 [Albula glossodonta]|uniref:Uncharacterized protein n=1 Tax=Albula glossodonta TaxID=121402 RepID=A0A8T2PNG9_9TELE|nr:hypothetical protein JZ751_020791 [Albula glossodonta]
MQVQLLIELEKKMDAKPTDVPVTTKQVVGITSSPFPSSSVTRFFKTKSGTPLWKREPKKEGKEVWKSTCEKELNQAESEGQMSRKNSNISPGVDIEAQAESAESA